MLNLNSTHIKKVEVNSKPIGNWNLKVYIKLEHSTLKENSKLPSPDLKALNSIQGIKC